MFAWDLTRERKRPAPLWLGAIVAAMLVGLMIWFRLSRPAGSIVPIGYGVPIILVGAFRRRKLLWLSTAAFIAFSLSRLVFIHRDLLNGGLVILDLLLISGTVDVWIQTAQSIDRKNRELEAANTDLASREEEIARQNEELQSQTEELERQSEELRVVNEELGQREKTLEILLSLSRSLHTQLSRGQIMKRICETLGLLVNGPDAAAGILEQQGEKMAIICHHGFGPEGPQEDSILPEQSFAKLVLSRGRTGYIEDIAARPDLRVPQPKTGEPIVSILATPLRVRGEAVGSLEVYSRRKCAWSQEQIALIESLAAQASISLEAAKLFTTISQERHRFEAVLRTVPVGIKVADAEYTEIRLNPAAAAMLNLPADERLPIKSLPARWQAYSSGRPSNSDAYPILRATRGEEIHGEEVDLVLANGRHITCLTYARPVRGPDGGLQGAVSVLVDITAQKELQRELDTRRREAEEASVRKTRFLAAVSHDIRTPANAISLLAELIRRTASNPAMAAEVPELAQELYGSAVSLVNLLSDVLDVARFDSDKIDLQESEFPISALLADEQKQLLPLARQKGLALECTAPDEPVLVRTDRIKLARILGNLIGNAIKFTEAGQVKIDAHRNGDGTVQISVSDTGIGIAPEHLPYIFDEFYQLRNPERDHSKGSGLGLSICKRLVDAMGGTIAVQSMPGNGSTFTVTLPRFATMPGRGALPAG